MNNISKLSSRVIYKIVTNIFTAIFNVIFSVIIPRSLGPSGFGLFELLNSNINQLISFLDSGTSSAFYTKLSQRPNDIGLINFYFKIVLFILIILCAVFIILVSFLNLNEIFSDDNSIKYFLLAIIFCFGLYVSISLRNAADAYILTIKSEILTVVIKAIGVLIVLWLFITKNLTIETLYYKEIIIIISIIFFSYYYILKKNWIERINDNIIKSNTNDLKKEFWNYSHPLLIMTIIVSINVIVERWILQIFSGSIQQGYYSLALRISSIAMMFGGALSTLLVREVAIHFNNNDLAGSKLLMEKSIKLMYVVVTIFVAFILLFSREIIIIFVGQKYIESIATMQILAFYPLHQIIGQYAGSYFLGAGETKLYRNITIISTLLGLISTWFLLAPKEYFGFELGSYGLALKTVLINIVIANISLYFVLKKIKTPFKNYLLHQILSLLIFISIAYICKYLAGLLFYNSMYILLFAGFIYILISFIVVFSKPSLIGSTKSEMVNILSKITKYMTKI